MAPSWPARPLVVLVLFLLGMSSIATLLLYFYGIAEMGVSVRHIVLPAIVLLVLVTLWARRRQRIALFHRILAGLWAGALATLTYDLVRVPVAWSGIPVFKAVSYFGTVIVGQPSPTITSEVLGWAYHLSNGIGFGLMYVAVAAIPHWWTAVLWGLLLEGIMLVTPYAEVFGYRVSMAFLALTIGAHVVYGTTLWAALRYWCHGQGDRWLPKHSPVRLALVCALVPLGLGAVAADFHQRYSATLPPSPPGYLGPHLYTTWNILEPDRLTAMWVFQRFMHPRARFHFVPPFSRIMYGTPFDTPEATIRRSGTQSVTEVLLTHHSLRSDSRLKLLARMTHLYEITPWMRPTDPAAAQFGQDLITTTGHCEPHEMAHCVERAFHYLDMWYAGQASLDALIGIRGLVKRVAQ